MFSRNSSRTEVICKVQLTTLGCVCILLHFYVMSSAVPLSNAEKTPLRLIGSYKSSNTPASYENLTAACRILCNGRLYEMNSKMDLRTMRYVMSIEKRNISGIQDHNICWAAIMSKSHVISQIRLVNCKMKPNFVCRCHRASILNKIQKRDIAYSFLYLKNNVISKVQQLMFGPGVCHSLPQLYQIDQELSSRVVGGQSAIYGSQPWQVEISKLTDGSYKHHCSGAIITPLFIITAAHCFRKETELKDFRVTTGDHNIGIKDAYEDSYEIDKVALHPQDSANTFDNDIAILKIKSSKHHGIVYGTHVQPACLPSKSTPHKPGTTCIVSGWGKTEVDSNNTNSNILKSANVRLLPTSRCQELYKNYSKISEGMLCAGHWEGGIDSCSGDSGGPLICNVINSSLLLGLVSWGEGCAQPNRPGVYVHVQHYLTWIYQTIKELS